MKLAITLHTYQRPDGMTPTYLNRAMSSIFSQTYQDFKLFVIGDKYEDEYELFNIINKYPLNKLYYENLPYAKEREKYINNKHALWCAGGVNAINYAIDKCLENGFEYVCHLDHDDYWTPEHLESIHNVINKTNGDWFCTRSLHINGNLPRVITDQEYVEFLPEACGLINSSTCINFKKIPLRFRDVLEEDGKAYPADADLWKRCATYIKDNNLKSYFINKLTCVHDLEGYSECS